MDDLRQLFTDLGHADVKTYIQSGNVVFRSTVGDASKLARGIESRIAADMDMTVTTSWASSAGRSISTVPMANGRTKLNNAYIEKRLGLAATTRGWKTVTKLHALAVVSRRQVR